MKHYYPRNRGVINRAIGFFKYTPSRFLLLLPVAAAIPTFQALVAWEFAWSPLNVKGLSAAIYAGGYLPTLLIIFIQVVFGFMTPNEDLELKRQRRVRGVDLDRELGIVHKPTWWRRIRDGGVSEANMNMRDRIAKNVREVGGGRATARNIQARNESAPEGSAPAASEAVEMTAVPARPLSQQAVDLLGPISPGDFESAHATATRYSNLSDRTRSQSVMETAAGMLFPNANSDPAAVARRRQELMMDGPPSTVAPPPYDDRGRSTDSQLARPAAAGRGPSADTMASVNQPPQQIRSMLDV